jgi:glycosyltransferase involved in cell wall biosynthesis
MYSVTISSIPIRHERHKDEDPQGVNLWGADVAKEGLIRALLQHSRCDNVFLPCNSQRDIDEARSRLTSYPHRERVQPILVDDYHSLAGHDRMVLFHPGGTGEDGVRDTGLHGLVNLRAYAGRPDWPVTGVTHSISGGPGSWLLLEALLRALQSHDALVCTSEAGRKAIERIVSRAADPAAQRAPTPPAPDVQLPVIPLGTDVDVYQPRDREVARQRCGLPRERVTFLYLGRFATHYKADLFPLILAFAGIPDDKRRRAHLVIAGDDSLFKLSSKFERFAAALGISAHVSVRPNPTSRDKAGLYNAADVFVSPIDSVQETFGQTMIEAMASGLPAIASDWDGYRDTVEHGTTGLLVPTYWADCFDHLRSTPFLRNPIDLYKQLGQGATVDLNALRQCMELMIDDGALRQSMGRAARRTALEKYDWPIIVQRFEELWFRLMGASTRDHTDIVWDSLTFDYLDTYRHHPTKLITPDSVVELSTWGLALAEDASILQLFTPTELSVMEDGTRRIVTACGPGEQVSVSQLIARLTRGDETRQRSQFQQIAQLLKYGILELR